jgi:hypothetical protein
MPHGWEFLPNAVPAAAKLTFNGENYGQNLPFYSTLYR